MKILITGGAGYIGSHIALELSKKKHSSIIFDNLSNGNPELIQDISRCELLKGDLLNPKDLERAFRKGPFDAVMHFAAQASVPESVQKPMFYYEQNVMGTLNLLKAMEKYNVKCFIFSSTAAVYGEVESLPIKEEHSCKPINPYGRSKHTIELILQDLDLANIIHFISLRYFNAAGADPDGRLGELHREEHHLIPKVLQSIKSAKKTKPKISIFGKNYPTPDGTCIRDYIHVTDLAQAHILALEDLVKNKKSQIFNLGNGRGYSVLQIAQVASEITDTELDIQFEPPRPGDPPILVASNTKIRKELGWVPEFSDIRQIIQHAWNWEQTLDSKSKKL